MEKSAYWISFAALACFMVLRFTSHDTRSNPVVPEPAKMISKVTPTEKQIWDSMPVSVEDLDGRCWSLVFVAPFHYQITRDIPDKLDIDGKVYRSVVMEIEIFTQSLQEAALKNNYDCNFDIILPKDGSLHIIDIKLQKSDTAKNAIHLFTTVRPRHWIYR